MNTVKEFILYNSEIENYLQTLTGKKNGQPLSDSELAKQKSALRAMIDILVRKGKTWPDADDYTDYQQSHDNNPKTIRDNIGRIERFFDWLQREKDSVTENNPVPVVETHVTALSDTPTVNDTESTPIEPVHVEPVKARGKPGRKRLDGENGEIRTEKITVYLTEKKATAFRALCVLDNVTMASRINALIDTELDKNKDIINRFLELKGERNNQA